MFQFKLTFTETILNYIIDKTELFNQNLVAITGSAGISQNEIKYRRYKSRINIAIKIQIITRRTLSKRMDAS